MRQAEMRQRLKESTPPGERYRQGITDTITDTDIRRFASRWGYSEESIRKHAQQAEQQRQATLNLLNPNRSNTSPITPSAPGYVIRNQPYIHAVRHTQPLPSFHVNYLNNPAARSAVVAATRYPRLM